MLGWESILKTDDGLAAARQDILKAQSRLT